MTILKKKSRRLRTTVFILAAVLAQTLAPGAWAQEAEATGRLSRDRLIQDIRQLSELLESAHPDPYINGGGKVAYHRRLQDLIRSIPDAGLTRQEFHVRLQPFIARLGDGHTSLPPDRSARDHDKPGGIPLYFDIVEKNLYVSAVSSAGHLPLVGSILESVEGVSFSTLVRRESEQRGHDNDHHALSGLGRDGALYFRESLRRLVPEWDGRGKIRVALRDASGKVEKHTLGTAGNVTYPLLRNESKLDLPDADRSFAYHFLDDSRERAYLRIDDMTTYREFFEYSRSIGSSGYEGWARRVYQRHSHEDPPDSMDDVIAGIPSASETFRSLFREMKAARSPVLIVDLQRNFGGNSLMVQILLYHLVGFDRTVSLLEETAAIQKLSPFFHGGTQAGVDLEAVAYHDRVPLKLGDYDFSSDSRFMTGGDLQESLRDSYTRMFEQMPSFFAVFSSREDEALYFPDKIVVLCGNQTQSSGFDLLTDLYRLGAVVVGVPSSQAGNSFGNIWPFELSNSKLSGYLSTKYFVAYPDQPATGFTLEPHHPLTYGKLAAYGFDRNATLLYALEILRDPGA
jgi:hypothetical protein